MNYEINFSVFLHHFARRKLLADRRNRINMSSMNLGLFKTSHFCLSDLVAGPIYSNILAEKIHMFLKMPPKTPLPFSLHLSQVSLEKLKSKKNTAKSKIQCLYYVDIRNINFNIQIILTFHLEGLCYPALCFLKIPPNESLSFP